MQLGSILSLQTSRDQLLQREKQIFPWVLRRKYSILLNTFSTIASTKHFGETRVQAICRKHEQNVRTELGPD